MWPIIYKAVGQNIQGVERRLRVPRLKAEKHLTRIPSLVKTAFRNAGERQVLSGKEKVRELTQRLRLQDCEWKFLALKDHEIRDNHTSSEIKDKQREWEVVSEITIYFLHNFSVTYTFTVY